MSQYKSSQNNMRVTLYVVYFPVYVISKHRIDGHIELDGIGYTAMN